MPDKCIRQVAAFSVSHTGFVDEAGQLVAEIPDAANDTEELVSLYRYMVLTRLFDAKAVALQRTGRLGTFASSLGQEAVGVGIGCAMSKCDVLLPSFREQAAQIVRGVRILELLLYWGGDERGSDYQDSREDFPICIPVGSQASHAAGVALAFKLRAQPRVAVCVFGDGATSKGDVYEAMNFAGVQSLPVVFVVNNNQWSISVPRTRQSAAATLAQKAIAAGFPGEQVDGNDVIAVRHVVSAAIQRARTGQGPTLIEAITYRMSDHTTADDASRYRSDTDVSERWKTDPVKRLREFLSARGDWNSRKEERLIVECEATVDTAVAEYLATDAQPPESMFDFLYAVLPPCLASQKESLRRRTRRAGLKA